MVLSTWESLLKLSLVLGFKLCYLVLLLNHRDLGLRGECFLSYVLVGCIYSEFERKYRFDNKQGENYVLMKKRSQRRTNSDAPFQTRVETSV